jgi:cytochrome oxidase Cu insertion factor (SCO1/SenC/PrrC family)
MKLTPFIAIGCLAALWSSSCSSRQPQSTMTSCCSPSKGEVAGAPMTASNQAAASGASMDLFATPFLAPAARRTLALDDRVTTQDGKVTTLRELVDRPTAISFAYSQCANPNKCPRVVNTMGLLRGDLEKAGLLGRVRLALITYDPGHDTPAVMRGFARINGYMLDDDSLFLRPEVDAGHKLFHDLEVRASFNDNGVALHGIQLIILDKKGRLARSYHTLLWDNHQAVDDLRRLAEE